MHYLRNNSNQTFIQDRPNGKLFPIVKRIDIGCSKGLSRTFDKTGIYIYEYVRIGITGNIDTMS